MNILPTDRIINTHEQNIDFRKISCSDQKIGYKPKGLWYALGDAWLQWVRSEEPGWEQPYNYKIEVNLNRMIVLDTIQKVKLFSHTKVFGVYDTYLNSSNHKYSDEFKKMNVVIDWPYICKKFSGIELNPYFYELRFDYLWYNGWDVPSGCIWRKDAIKKITRIKND